MLLDLSDHVVVARVVRVAHDREGTEAARTLGVTNDALRKALARSPWLRDLIDNNRQPETDVDLRRLRKRAEQASTAAARFAHKTFLRKSGALACGKVGGRGTVCATNGESMEAEPRHVSTLKPREIIRCWGIPPAARSRHAPQERGALLVESVFRDARDRGPGLRRWVINVTVLATGRRALLALENLSDASGSCPPLDADDRAIVE